MEAATDPQPFHGYHFSDNTNPWSYVPGGAEVGDVCDVTNDEYNGQFWAQRIWSNTAAKQENQSPCIPTPSGYQYFTTIVTNGDGGAAATVKAGDTAIFTATGWSQGSVPNFTVAVQNPTGGSAEIAGGSSTTLNNGVQVQLKVSVASGLPSGTPVYVELDSTMDNFGSYSATPVVVFVQ
jgi:hypothetical protein